MPQMGLEPGSPEYQLEVRLLTTTPTAPPVRTEDESRCQLYMYMSVKLLLLQANTTYLACYISKCG